MDGYLFIDKLSCNAFNEGIWLQDSVAQYRRRFGHYPAEVLADQIYCNRENRRWLKEGGIRKGQAAWASGGGGSGNHVSPGGRNAVEGKFGQGKLGYGLDCIKAKLQETSESWIACIALVLNLVRLAGKAPLFPCRLAGFWLTRQFLLLLQRKIQIMTGELFSKPSAFFESCRNCLLPWRRFIGRRLRQIIQ